jgi:hypothetical protein
MTQLLTLKEKIMTDQNKKPTLKATALKASKMQTTNQILKVKTYKSAAGFTSARPSKSFIKVRSLTKPALASKK